MLTLRFDLSKNILTDAGLLALLSRNQHARNGLQCAADTLARFPQESSIESHLQEQFCDRSPQQVSDALLLLRTSAFKLQSRPSLLLGSLCHISERGFDISGTEPKLQLCHLLDFQHLATQIWPDQLYCFAWVRLAETQRIVLSDRELRQRFTTGMLPPLELPDLHRLRQQGLSEIHRHFNGSSLPGLFWHKALCYPWLALPDRGKTRESGARSPYRLLSLLQAAAQIRRLLVDDMSRSDFAPRGWRALSDAALAADNKFSRAGLLLADVPQPSEVGRGQPTDHDILFDERRLLYHAFTRLCRESGGLFARLLHAYLILQNHVMTGWLVQPDDSVKGFDRFDTWYSQNPLRDHLEQAAAQRLRQAAKTGGVRRLELRVAPKNSTEDWLRLVKKIIGEPPRRIIPGARPTEEQSEELIVGIVVHFIREADRTPKAGLPWPPPPRHAVLRRKLWQQASVLARFRNDSRWGRYIVGLDVANSEMKTRPDVFAPVIRWLRSAAAQPRNNSPLHQPQALPRLPLTYHAGEDYRHLLSGIRMVDEALLYLDMGPGDRIGHGLALGVEPEQWWQTTGGEVYLSRGEWLDNLVWWRERLARYAEYSGLMLNLDGEIAKFSKEIYRTAVPWTELHEAWRDRGEALPDYQPPGFTWNAPKPLTGWLHRYHNDRQARIASNQVIAVTLPDDVPTTTWLGAMRRTQKDLLAELSRRKMAIEANPTSNRTIGNFGELPQHPIFRWHPPGVDDTDHPLVIVGSDDPGIFGTELQYEYAYLAAAAQQRGASGRAIRNWLEDLAKTSNDFCFVERISM